MGKTMSTTRNQNYDVPWSDLNHDVLSLVMMRVGVVDFVSFSGVCKSWRSFAHSNRNRFMASRPPMSISISPSPPPMLMCISPRVHKNTCHLEDFEGRKFKTIIPHSAGREYVGLTCGLLDIVWEYVGLTLLKTNNFPKQEMFPMFVSWGEKLYVVHYFLRKLYSFHELDFGKMKWVRRKKTREEYAFFSSLEHIAAFKPELWADTKNSWKDRVNYARMWYFPHHCFNVNLIG